MLEIRGGRMKRQQIIAICGPYSGGGHTILSQLAEFLRTLDFPAYLCSELCPAEDPNDPEAVRQASYECMKLAKAYILVFLSPASLGPDAKEVDLTGGTAFEAGLLYAAWKEKDDICVACLFDDLEHQRRVSKMLQGKWMGLELDAVLPIPGDTAALNELAAQLCAGLVDLIHD